MISYPINISGIVNGNGIECRWRDCETLLEVFMVSGNAHLTNPKLMHRFETCDKEQADAYLPEWLDPLTHKVQPQRFFRSKSPFKVGDVHAW